MGVLVLTPEIQTKIDAIVADAARNPIPWAILQHLAVKNDRPILSLEERRKTNVQRPEAKRIKLGTYDVAYSVEEQPAGMLKHLSISTHQPKKTLPQPYIVDEIAKAFGLTDRINWVHWIEEFAPGEHALNIVQITGEPSNIETGHA